MRKLDIDYLINQISQSPDIQKIDEGFKGLAQEFSIFNQKTSRGMGLDISPTGMVAADNAKASAENILGSLISGTALLGLQLYSRQYMQGFQYITEPSLQAASASMGGYFDVLARGLSERERLAQQYRMVALNSVVSGTASTAQLLGRVLAPAILNRVAAARAAATMTARTMAAFGLSRIGGGLLASLFGPVGAVIAAVSLAWSAFSLFQNIARSKELTKMAENKSLMELFNPKALMSMYQKNAFLLGTEHSRGQMGGMELLIGTDWEDALASGRFPTSPNSLTGRVYNAAFSGSYSENSVGFDVRNFGFDNEKILNVSGNLERNLQTGANENLVAQILMMSGLYTGGDTSLMESISTQIVRSSGFTDRDVNEATQRFEEFFSVVVGDGRPQAAHLKLVSALSTFSYDYAMGVRANLGATTEIAKIQQFMGDNGMINGRFDVTATKTAVQSLDDILLKGATMQDLNAIRIVSSMGISREDAIRGVTYDANTFDKFLGGMTSFLNVTNEDVVNRTSRFDEGLQNLALMTNMNMGQMNALIVALTRYAQGERVEDVRVGYMENLASDANAKLEPYLRFTDSYEGAFSALQIIGNITYSNNKLYDAINLNLDTINKFNDIMMSAVDKAFEGAIPYFLSAVQNFLKVISNPASMLALSKNQVTKDLNFQQAAVTREAAPGAIDAVDALSIRREVNRRGPTIDTANVNDFTTPQIRTTILTVDEYMNTLPDDAAAVFYQIVLENNLGNVIDENFKQQFRAALSKYPEDVYSRFTETKSVSEEVRRQEESEVYQKIHSRLGETGKENFSPAFFDKAKEVAERLGIPVEYLLTVIHFETMGTFSSTIRPTRRDGSLISSAIGLIQFLSATAEGLGTTTELLSQMTPVQQLEYVEKYFKQHKNKIKEGMSLEDVYLIVFTPAAAGKPSDHVLYRRGDAGYAANNGLDLDGDGKITKWEITSRIRDRYSRLFNQDRAVGGLVFPGSAGMADGKFGVKHTNMHINIPISSMSPHRVASAFSESMSNLLGV
jgi:hypothetical protein